MKWMDHHTRTMKWQQSSMHYKGWSTGEEGMINEKKLKIIDS